MDAAFSTEPLHRALAMLGEALELWGAEPAGSRLAPHLRSSVIQSYEFSYELSVRLLRRALAERSASAQAAADLSFNSLLRAAADAGLLDDALSWRHWRELRNATSHAYDEATAARVAASVPEFLPQARQLLERIDASIGT
jgi:nucleotidyltransferase substrate binding protein (TIGR01987 family)